MSSYEIDFEPIVDVMLVYTYTEHYIIPLTPTADQPFFRTIIDLILPFMVRAVLWGVLYLYMNFGCMGSSYVIFCSFSSYSVSNQSILPILAYANVTPPPRMHLQRICRIVFLC